MRLGVELLYVNEPCESLKEIWGYRYDGFLRLIWSQNPFTAEVSYP